jgi:hypothetical protein
MFSSVMLLSPPPPHTHTHTRCDGEAECYLHLHGMSAWESPVAAMPAVYSNPSAPGLIMASGNTALQGFGLDDNDG